MPEHQQKTVTHNTDTDADAHPDCEFMGGVRALMVRVVPALLEVDISHPSYQL
jgi:hypothetical protein